jgi:hypothetical protein
MNKSSFAGNTAALVIFSIIVVSLVVLFIPVYRGIGRLSRIDTEIINYKSSWRKCNINSTEDVAFEPPMLTASIQALSDLMILSEPLKFEVEML